MGFGSSRPKLDERQINILDEQKNKSICKLRIYGEIIGYGFLCKIPETNTKILIAYKKDLNSDKLKDKKTLELIINNDTISELFINLNKERIKYDSENNELFILEIKEDDELEITDFIEIEEINNFDKYKEKDIYILPYIVEDKKFPVGKIEDVKQEGKKKIIKHNCNNLGKNQLVSLFPILNLKSNKIIGINKDNKTGFFMKEDIDAFKKKIEEIKELNISNKVKEEEIFYKPTPTIEDIEHKSIENIDHEIDRQVDENRNKIQNDRNDLNNNEKIYTNNGNIINNIIIIIKVSKEEIEFNKNKKQYVYFFDNLEVGKDQRQNGFLKEIEEKEKKMPNLEFNVTISDPDNEKKNYNKFMNKFIPRKEGSYDIEIKIPVYISDCSYMFYNCPNITDVNLSNFELSHVTKMNDMFNYCINLTKVTFPGNETKSLDNMAYMFNYCKNLKSVDFKNIDTEKVTDMSGMFQNCEQLEKLDLTNFCTLNVSSLNCMFNDCYNLKSIKFSQKFNTDKVLFMNYLFFGCEKMEELDLSYFSINNYNYKEMENMFEGCDKLKKIFVNKNYLSYFKKIHGKEKDKFSKK